MRRDRRSEGCRALRRRRRLALRTVLHGNRRVRAYCGSYPWADVLPHDSYADDAGALTSADDGRAVAGTHA